MRADDALRGAAIGVAGQTTTLPQVLRRALHIELERAVRVMQVTTDGPAEQAGLRVGDMIWRIDHRAVASVDALRRYLERLPHGATVRVSAIRLNDRSPEIVEVAVATQLG